MRISENWRDYELIDASSGEKLERWGDIILIRPDPQAIWKTEKRHPLWKNAHARYIRSGSGGGRWQYYKQIPEKWSINYRELCFNLKPMGFKHTGLFPEQAVNWDLLDGMIKGAKRPLKVLNLFAYTGGATLACLAAGAAVTHVDASKGMVSWARENAAASNLDSRPVRWIVDDCIKFVSREIRRGNLYDGIILDPPSYGRGPSGEVWQLEDSLYDFLQLCSGVLSRNPAFVLLNSYTTGLSSATMEYMLGSIFYKKYSGRLSSDEIGLYATATGLKFPCGSTAVWRAEDLSE